tara:strand:- start:440 stop:622 length:183 start_codon:yes stop_codon:yes gene_type:complete
MMGRMKDYLQEWLENHGWELGYDMANIPDIDELDYVVENEINAETYWTIRKKEMEDERRG